MIPAASLNRRTLLAGAGCTVLLAALRSPAALAAMREETHRISATAIAAPEPVQPLPYRLFYDLSRYLTAREQLDERFARQLFETFRQEEWGWAQAAKLYALIRAALADGMGAAPELMAAGRLDDSEQWYGEHLINAWYDGLYWFDGKVTRIGYEQTLMWQTVGDILPVQGLSDRPYGYWTERPVGTDGR